MSTTSNKRAAAGSEPRDVRYRAARESLKRVTFEELIVNDAATLAAARQKPSDISSAMIGHIHALFTDLDRVAALSSTAPVNDALSLAKLSNADTGPFMYLYEFDADEGLFVDKSTLDAPSIKTDYFINDLASNISWQSTIEVKRVRSARTSTGAIKYGVKNMGNGIDVMRQLQRKSATSRVRTDGKQENWTRREYRPVTEEVFYDEQGVQHVISTVKAFPVLLVYLRKTL